MILFLVKYYLEAKLFGCLPESYIKQIHIRRFRKIFEWAREHSEFYRQVYTQAGVMDLRIESFDDIKKVPIVDKKMMRTVSLESRLTCKINNKLVRSMTSGSNGIPLNVYASKKEHFTGYVRTLLAIKAYNPFKPFILIGTHEEKEQVEEQSFIGFLRKYLGMFRRETISVLEPVEQIVAQLVNRKIGILTTTPSCLKIIMDEVKSKRLELNVKRIVLSGETIDETLRWDIKKYFHAKLINVYGCVEHPSLAWTKPNGEKFNYFLSSVFFEHINEWEHNEKHYGELVLTNFTNKTMPFVRYKIGDQVEVVDDYKTLGKIEGRADDVIQLANGEKLFMYQMDAFTKIEAIFQFKIIQKKTSALVFQVVGVPGCNKKKLKHEISKTWKNLFPDLSIEIEFLVELPVNPISGKLKRMEIET
ncbi:hypothetical protein [uncultured Draconibacterium sp.]|uniref:hypothetical protein n=1 Tax=uncultured Draconibacterium sp. TaxID=1573823 RepID=UPI0032619D15